MVIVKNHYIAQYRTRDPSHTGGHHQLTCVLCDSFHALACELSQVAIQRELVVQNLVSLDLDVGCLALSASQGLMDHDP